MSEPALGVKVRANGTVIFPGVVEYELTAGPERGKRLLRPPTVATHGDSRSVSHIPLGSAYTARTVAESIPGGWDGRPISEAVQRPPSASWPYRVIILDPARYEVLRATGWLYDPRHCERSEIIDQRTAPGA